MQLGLNRAQEWLAREPQSSCCVSRYQRPLKELATKAESVIRCACCPHLSQRLLSPYGAAEQCKVGYEAWQRDHCHQRHGAMGKGPSGPTASSAAKSHSGAACGRGHSRVTMMTGRSRPRAETFFPSRGLMFASLLGSSPPQFLYNSAQRLPLLHWG